MLSENEYKSLQGDLMKEINYILYGKQFFTDNIKETIEDVIKKRGGLATFVKSSVTGFESIRIDLGEDSFYISLHLQGVIL